MKEGRQTINLPITSKADGPLITEEVLVDAIGDGLYKIVATPGLVLGLAADDLIKRTKDARGFVVVERGNNIAIQLFGKTELVDIHLQELSEITPRVDGRDNNLTILTVPLQFGFSRIERVLHEFCNRHRGVEWYYGNVYDPADGITPLNWWLRTWSLRQLGPTHPMPF